MPRPIEDDAEMPFLDHLEELRKVIIKCVLALAASCFVIGIFTVQFNELLMYPFNKAQADFGQPVALPRVGSVFAPFFVMFEIAVFGGIFVALPFVLYFLARFVAPALTARERSVITPGCVAAVALFASGAALAFFFILPTGIRFSFEVSQMMNWEILYDLENYYSSVVWVPLATGVSFELPLLVVILIYIGALKPEFLKKYRRVIFVAIMIFAAVVTPPDPLTLVLLTVPLYLLYEAAVFVGVRLLGRKLKARADEEYEESFRAPAAAGFAGDDPRYSETRFKAEDAPGANALDDSYLNYGDAETMSMKEINALGERNPSSGASPDGGDSSGQPDAEKPSGEPPLPAGWDYDDSPPPPLPEEGGAAPADAGGEPGNPGGKSGSAGSPEEGGGGK